MADFEVRIDPDVFGDPNFNVKKWLNSALSPKDKESAEKNATTLSTKLQPTIFELRSLIEDLSGRCLMHIPGALKEIEILMKDVAVLKGIVDNFEQKLVEMEDQTKDSVILLKLDTIKSRMESVTTILSQSQKYNELMKNMDSVMDSHNSDQIVSFLQQMNESVRAFKGIPIFADAEKKQEMYLAKLDQDFKPKLNQALIQRNVDETIKYHKIYEQIGRESRVTQSYSNIKAMRFEQIWENFLNKNAGHSPLEWLPSFYDELQLEITEELSWTSSVFPARSALVAMALYQFNTKIKDKFEALLKPLSLANLISLYLTTKDFEKSIVFLDQLSETPTDTHWITRKMAVGSIYLPYMSFQANYAELQRSHIHTQIQIILPKKGDFLHTIGAIDNSLPKLFLLFESALDSCVSFTTGSEGEALVDIFNNTLLFFSNHLSGLLQQLRSMAKLEQESAHPIPESTSTEMIHDWGESYFQGALQLLEIVEKMITKLVMFEGNVQATLADQAQHLFGGLDSLRDINQVSVCHIVSINKARNVFQFMKDIQSPGFKLFPVAFEKYQSFLVSTQTFVFDAMSSYIKQKLNRIVTLPVWSQVVQGKVPQFNFTPQVYVKLVVEHLINLRELLEPYDNNKALNLATKAKDLGKHMYSSAIQDEEDKDEQLEGDEHEEEEGFAFQWILAVVSGTMTLYYVNISQIPSLSNFGTTQLAVDIGHLFNVLKVLGVRPSHQLTEVLKYLQMDVTSIQEQLDEGTISEIGRMIAKKRAVEPQLANELGPLSAQPNLPTNN